ncbi:MAG: cadmium resistance transporter [Schleiferilactobacillus harbinensis]|jgi:cadmium resistance transport/sequestration family protein|nr:cadmium resistance transporter [Schleiferilactobacillus harbinensis]MCI1912435.1 cadmium resistance transporter [Schleiferilactobacillus harbinensis]
MIKTIITGVTAYISTSIDYLLILMVVFGSTPKKQRWLVYFGDLLGTSILVGTSLLLAFALGLVPATWLLGLLGLIPVGMGLKLLIWGDDDSDSEVDDALRKHRSIILKVALITVVTCGADNIGIYVPLFTQIEHSAIPVILVTFLVMLTLFCLSGYLISRIPKVAGALEQYGRYVTAVVYILIGLDVLWDGGTLQHIFFSQH